MIKIKLFVAIIALSFILSPYPAFAGIVKLWGQGVNISNTGGTGQTYGYGRKASDGSLFAYYEVGDYYSGVNILLKKIDKNGSVLWEKLVTTVSQNLAIVDLAPDKNGGAVAVWMTGYELRAKRFDSSGNEDTIWGTDGVVVFSYGGYAGSGIRNSAVSDGSGGVIVVYGMWNDSIYAQRVGSDGTLKWNNGEPVWIGNGNLFHDWTQTNNVVPDEKGGVFIAWIGDGARAQYVDSDGRLSWQTGGIVAMTDATHGGDLIHDSTGGVIILASAGDNLSIIAQRIDSLGNLLWGDNGIVIKNIEKVCGGPRRTFIESVGNNEFVVVYDGMEADAASCGESDIYAQKIDINGNLKWNPDGVIISDKDKEQFNNFPHITTDGKDGVWVSFFDGPYYGRSSEGYLAVQHLDNNGNIFSCTPIRQQTYNQSSWSYSIVSDNEGGAYILWDAVAQKGDVYAQRFAKMGNREVCAITVTIDIKPGSFPNSINLSSKGVVPVAVFTTDDFDASMIDAATVTFAGAKVLRNASEDVNGDGRIDMVFHFNTEDLKLDPTDTVAILTGKTVDGKSLAGEDSVNIVPKRK